MDGFYNELNEGEIQFRDNLQFELKSEYPEATTGTITYTQEFYLFIPNALQINNNIYPRQEFYLDQTNFIRFKTPKFSFAELLNPHNDRSPLFQLYYFATKAPSFSLYHAEDEMKLLGNIIRSSLREKVIQMLNLINHQSPAYINKVELIKKQISELLTNMRAVQEKFSDTQEILKRRVSDPSLSYSYDYVNEFISRSIDYYLTGFAFEMAKKQIKEIEPSIEELKRFIIEEKQNRELSSQEKLQSSDPEVEKESILYREGHLNKFMLEALQLTPTRQAHSEKYSHLVGSAAAGVAMLLYMLLFVWQGTVMAINSTPFIIFAVVIYMIKDRLKEGFKLFYQRFSQKWFPDYITKVSTVDGKASIGKLSEFFSYLSEEKIPPVVANIRNTEFHHELVHMKRHESVIFYKKTFALFPKQEKTFPRRHEINTIFRFNIHRFLEKASNSYETSPVLDPFTGTIEEKLLPKVYHLNMIIKNTIVYPKQPSKINYQKFRIVLDKSGIKRVEQINER